MYKMLTNRLKLIYRVVNTSDTPVLILMFTEQSANRDPRAVAVRHANNYSPIVTAAIAIYLAICSVGASIEAMRQRTVRLQFLKSIRHRSLHYCALHLSIKISYAPTFEN